MKEIGKKLKEQRIKKNISYDEIASITKMPVSRIKAIEEGNLDVFQDDLAYVRFYVRAYCKALNVPYENIKEDVVDSIDEYTQTLVLKAGELNEQIEQNVIKNVKTLGDSKLPQFAKKDRISIGENTKNRRFEKKRIDFAFLSLIIVGVLVVGIILYVAVGSLLDKKVDDPTPQDKTQEKVDVPTPEKEKEEVQKPQKQEETSKVKFEKTSNAYQYNISGVKKGENLKIKVTFKNAGNFSLWRTANGKDANIEGNQYEAGKSYTLKTKLEADSERFTMNFWNYGGATVEINGKKQEFTDKDGLTQNSGGSIYTVLQFDIKGE